MKVIRILALLAAVVAVAGAFATPAAAFSSLTGYYYVIPAGHVDVEHGIDGTLVTGLVGNALGPNGLPVATSYAMTRSTGSGPIKDVNALTKEILWWSIPDSVPVKTDPVPIDVSSFFVTGFSSNPPYRAVHWQGSFVAPSAGLAQFSLSADDDAWLFVNGQLLIDNGGVKAIELSPSLAGATGLVAGNTYNVDLFFADRHTVQSAVKFCSTVTLFPVPEPMFFQMGALLGLGGLSMLRMRRRESVR